MIAFHGQQHKTGQHQIAVKRQTPMVDNLYVALIHFPVINKKGDTIGSALTTIDLHDIARASATFGVNGFFVITPYEDQASLAGEVISHWTKGVGGKINPTRKKALELIRVKAAFEDAVKEIEKERNEPVVTIATTARKQSGSLNIKAAREMIQTEQSHLLVFGTAWGLTEELMTDCDYILDPISGNTGYNHLSVRSAVSIYLDRLAGRNE